MQVKIIKSKYKEYWYNNRIGEIFDVYIVHKNKPNMEYYSLNDNTSRTILFEDATPIIRKEKIYKILNNIRKCK